MDLGDDCYVLSPKAGLVGRSESCKPSSNDEYLVMVEVIAACILFIIVHSFNSGLVSDSSFIHWKTGRYRSDH